MSHIVQAESKSIEGKKERNVPYFKNQPPCRGFQMAAAAADKHLEKQVKY